MFPDQGGIPYGKISPRTGVRGVSTGLERLNLDEKLLQILAKMLVTPLLHLVNGITEANGLITLTPGDLMSITVLLQVIGVNTLIRLWNIMVLL